MLIRGINDDDGKGGFSCGVPALDHYLASRAWTNELIGISRTYVLVDHAASTDVMGFYTLSARSIEPSMLTGLYAKRLPKYPVPVLYIGMFGVSVRVQRRGLGVVLMRDALNRCLAASEEIGAMGIYLDSLDAKSTAFYDALGFEAVGAVGEPQPMFLSMATLRQAG